MSQANQAFKTVDFNSLLGGVNSKPTTGQYYEHNTEIPPLLKQANANSWSPTIGPMGNFDKEANVATNALRLGKKGSTLVDKSKNQQAGAVGTELLGGRGNTRNVQFHKPYQFKGETKLIGGQENKQTGTFNTKTKLTTVKDYQEANQRVGGKISKNDDIAKHLKDVVQRNKTKVGNIKNAKMVQEKKFKEALTQDAGDVVSGRQRILSQREQDLKRIQNGDAPSFLQKKKTPQENFMNTKKRPVLQKQASYDYGEGAYLENEKEAGHILDKASYLRSLGNTLRKGHINEIPYPKRIDNSNLKNAALTGRRGKRKPVGFGNLQKIKEELVKEGADRTRSKKKTPKTDNAAKWIAKNRLLVAAGLGVPVLGFYGAKERLGKGAFERNATT